MYDCSIEQIETDSINTNPFVSIAIDIVKNRIQTRGPNYTEKVETYAKNLRSVLDVLNSNNIEKINKKGFGFLNEAIFYKSCLENNFKIHPSNGDYDKNWGIDFFLETKSKTYPIDVTLNKSKYLHKFTKAKSIPILLPPVTYILQFTHNYKNFPYYQYIKDLIDLNTSIIKNTDPMYKIRVYQKESNRKTLDKYRKKNKKATHNSKIISIPERKYIEILELLSILNNPTLLLPSEAPLEGSLPLL